LSQIDARSVVDVYVMVANVIVSMACQPQRTPANGTGELQTSRSNSRAFLFALTRIGLFAHD